MRKINVSQISDTVRELCLKANFDLRRDILSVLKKALGQERSPRAKKIIGSIIENAEFAKRERLAICQDTGMVSVYIEVGRSCQLVGGALAAAIDKGVEKAYKSGYLRKSIVGDPLGRKNTQTNTPSVIHTEIVEGDRIHIAVSPKGFGSENKSAIAMMRPTAGLGEIEKFICEVVKAAGADACPPYVIGVGIGGTFDQAALLSKKALLVSIDKVNPKKSLAHLEKRLRKRLNGIGIGPMALGGNTTVLGVNILDYPTHIAGLPVAVSVSCHATRSAEALI